jgi:nucleoside-triphosphatase THEP1
MFDAQCDFATVVYGASDDPDRLLLDFAEELRREGVRAAGLVQLDRGHHPSDDGDLRTVVLSNREVVHLNHHRERDTPRCRLDGSSLASLAKTIEAAIREGADLVVINRFGKLEAEGKGLIELIQLAAKADIPMLIAVPEHRFAAWIAYSGGMSVRLPCRREALDRWWRSVAMQGDGPRAATGFCAHSE